MFVLGVDKPGSHVGPGETFKYVWEVSEGPSPSDPPCVPYLYYSATQPAEDTNSGLVGPLLVCKKGTLSENGTQVLFVFIQYLLSTFYSVSTVQPHTNIQCLEHTVTQRR